MKCVCPACDGPNEANSGKGMIRCVWCGTVFSPSAAAAPERPVSSDSRSANEAVNPAFRSVDEKAIPTVPADSTVTAETAAAAADAAKASLDAAAAVLEAAKKSGAGADPEWTAGILAEAAKAAATAAAAAKAAEAAAAAAAASASALNRNQNAAYSAIPEPAPASAAAAPAAPVAPAAPASGTPPLSQSAVQPSGASQPAAQTPPQSTPPQPPQRTVPPSGAVQPGASRTAPPGQGQAAGLPSAAEAPKAPSGPRYVWRKFADNKTGIVLAKAVVPESFASGGTLVQKWQSDVVPFTASFQAVSPDRSILFSSNSGENYTWYLNPLIRSLVRQTPNFDPATMREFIEPEEYLQQYAQQMAGFKLTATARTGLPSAYGKDLAGERQRLLQYVESHMINISVRETVSTCYCDAFLYRYEGVSKGRRIVVLAGCDYRGVETYDANGGPAGMGLLSMGMQGGLVGHLMRSKQEKEAKKAADGKHGRRGPRVSPTGVGAGSIPFGHGKEHGKSVDAITWGSERLYFMAAPAEAEKAATAAFLRFVSSIAPDPALWKQRSLLIEQKHQTRIIEAQQLHNTAMQMRIDAQRRQQELTRQIQANSEEISRGIMDSWEKQSASHSRISENWSQAIRGVDTYRTPSGRTVEASVSADHVYQNRYGDTIEVSGPALDDELTSRLDWTELNRDK